MDRTLHDMRNELTVATAMIHAFIDGKLVPNQAYLSEVLAALANLDATMSELRAGSRKASISRNEDLLAAVVEGSPYAKILVNERGRMFLVNAQTEKLFGYRRDDLLGRSIEMLVPERFRPGHPGLREFFNAAPEARPMGAGRNLYGRRKDGTEVPIEIGLNPIEIDTGTYTLAAITDITERKRAEALGFLHAGVQQHASELEALNLELGSASRFKTQFIATMSHELRTPLSAIIGAAELLNRADLPQRERVSVETINEAAEALFSLINSVLDFSKIEAGKMDLHSVPFEVEKVFESAAEVVAQLAREKGIRFHAYVDQTIPPVRGDGDRLRQILMNLLGNAVKFTERGRVVARVFPIERLADEIVLRFEVQDTGIGIAPDVVATLFEPFAQADNSATRRFGGTGLGLSISKRLVELMGGEIGLQSDLGAGSLFWFTVPFQPAAEPVAARKTFDGIAGLILSGDDTFAEIIERYMTSWSVKSRRAVSRSDVVGALQSDDGPTWVAIVDMDDIGVVDLEFTLANVQVLMPARVIAIGKGGQLHKPVRQSYLFDAITKLVDVTESVASRGTGAAEPERTRRATGVVLVAEDDARLQRLLKLQFDELGTPVTFVLDGLAALEAVRREHYSMVFMDCQMPNMDGLTATRAIREEERRTGGHIPIAAMTANAFAEDRNICIAAGMDDYLSKPVKLADLRAMIVRWAKPDA